MSDTSEPAGLRPNNNGAAVSLVRRERFKEAFGLSLPLGLLLLVVNSGTAATQTVPTVGPLAGQGFVRMTGDMLGYELVPSFNGTYKGAPFNTNRWGMRDKDYALVAPPRTYRIALVGSSFTMGAGVPEEKTAEALLEDRLNSEATTATHRRYEILNFSVGGYRSLQYLAVVEKKVFLFAPNAVFIVIHPGTMPHLLSLLRRDIPIEEADLRQKLRQVGVRPGMEEPELRRRLAPIASDIERWSYQRIADLCREHGVALVGIVLPETRDDAPIIARAAALGSEMGIPLLRLDGVYNGHSYKSVQLPGDVHLNALGHQLVADRLYEVLRKNDPLGLWAEH